MAYGVIVTESDGSERDTKDRWPHFHQAQANTRAWGDLGKQARVVQLDEPIPEKVEESAQPVPVTEDQLKARVAYLEGQVVALRAQLAKVGGEATTADEPNPNATRVTAPI